MKHIESRPSQNIKVCQFELFVDLACDPKKMDKVVAELKAAGPFPNVTLTKPAEKPLGKLSTIVSFFKYNSTLDCLEEKLWIPMSIWELDNCNHLNIKYEPDIDSRHPVS